MSQLKGEYWLQAGLAVFADGDVGDVNHERVVFEHLLEEFETVLEGKPLLADLHYAIVKLHERDGGDPTMLREMINNLADTLHREGKITDEQVNDAFTWLGSVLQWPRDRFELLLDINNAIDPRKWALEHLGWFRTHGNACELWQLSRANLKQLAAGLYDAHEEEALGALYVLEVWHSRHQVFYDVPFAVLEKWNLTGLLPYRAHGGGR